MSFTKRTSKADVIYRPEFFRLEELVPPEVFEQRQDKAWELLDSRMLRTLDQLRDEFGPIVINDWHAGGRFVESGFRVGNTSTGARLSQHKFGRGFDLKFKQNEPAAVAKFIQENRKSFPFLTTIEDPERTKSWLHIDNRNNETDEIRIVQP